MALERWIAGAGVSSRLAVVRRCHFLGETGGTVVVVVEGRGCSVGILGGVGRGVRRSCGSVCFGLVVLVVVAWIDII